MVIVNPPKFVKALYSQLTWELPNNQNYIYLTFDDGPTPKITNWILDTLKSFGIKASFFCLGKNVMKYPAIFERILEEEHTIGNHSFSHLNGWKSKNEAYFGDFEKCQELIQSKFIRPPYGRITRSQAKYLNQFYKIIMWNVLSGDYDKKITPEKCLSNVMNNTQSGSIIVFHDSLKAEQNLKYTLPKSIESLLKKGFHFKEL